MGRCLDTTIWVLGLGLFSGQLGINIFEKKSRNLDNLKESLLKAFNYCICQKDYDKFLNGILLQYKDLNSDSAKYLNTYICSNILSNTTALSQLIANYSDFPKLYQMVNQYCIPGINCTGHCILFF